MLGECPGCGAFGVIALDVPAKRNAKCVKCGREWPDWMEDLILEENRKDRNSMNPVIMETGRSSIALLLPVRKNIDFRTCIDKVTEAAIREIFSCSLTREDEVELADNPLYLRKTGIVMGFKPPLLKTDIFKKGEVTYDLAPMATAGDRYKKLFEWIESFWRLIFMDEFRFGGIDFGRGAILGLSSDRPMHLPIAKMILYYALLETTASEELTDRIMDRIADRFDARSVITEHGRRLPESKIAEMLSNAL